MLRQDSRWHRTCEMDYKLRRYFCTRKSLLSYYCDLIVLSSDNNNIGVKNCIRVGAGRDNRCKPIVFARPNRLCERQAYLTFSNNQDRFWHFSSFYLGITLAPCDFRPVAGLLLRVLSNSSYEIIRYSFFRFRIPCDFYTGRSPDPWLRPDISIK